MIALLRLLIAKDLGLVSGRNRGLSRENMPSQDAGRPLIAAVHSRSPRCPKCGACLSAGHEPDRHPPRFELLQFHGLAKPGPIRGRCCPRAISLKPRRLRRQEVHASWLSWAASLTDCSFGASNNHGDARVE